MADDSVEVTLNVPADVTLEQLFVTEDTEIVAVDGDYESDKESLSERFSEARGELKMTKAVGSTSFEEGDYAIDDRGPTPSAEKNTVRIVEVTDDRIDEHAVGSSDQSVYEYNDRAYPASDRVVRAEYPHLNTEKVFSFPASRLREV
jgi:hypothetical protein